MRVRRGYVVVHGDALQDKVAVAGVDADAVDGVIVTVLDSQVVDNQASVVNGEDGDAVVAVNGEVGLAGAGEGQMIADGGKLAAEKDCAGRREGEGDGVRAGGGVGGGDSFT